MAERRFLTGGADGWLKVRREPSRTLVALPEFLQVDLTGISDGRDYFVAVEGVESGSEFSVTTGFLKRDNPGLRGPAKLEFVRSANRLSYAGKSVEAITSDGSPIPIGEHSIQIPDFPHLLGAAYMTDTAHAKSWFHLGRGVAIVGQNDRYLHTGLRSAGCITVDPTAWSDLYRHLILSRMGDGKSVGTVLVKG